MRVITTNVNGIRSAAKKGFFDWLQTQQADIVCVQELKAQRADLENAVFHPAGYKAYFQCAEKKGYSGVGIYSKIKPKRIIDSLGFETADQEGRYLQLDFDAFSVASLYLPSGTSGEDRQSIKFDFLARYAKHLQTIRQSSQEMIICGDWNIAHQPIDLKNWKGNQKNSGFLPEERAWMDRLFGEMEYIDAFRVVNQAPDQYTWWSHRGQAWAKNVGWRIDYQVLTPGLKQTVSHASIYKEQRFSDHAPLVIDYTIEI